MKKTVTRVATILAGVPLVAGLLISLPASNVQAVPDSRLWLPVSYRVHMGKLRKAAKLVEDQAESCETIISGSLHVDLSSKQRPIFKFVCRNPQRRSFALLIDGISQEVVDSRNPSETKSFEALRQEKLARLEQQRVEAELSRRAHFWTLCEQALERRTTNMRDLQWLTTDKPEPDVSLEGHVRYFVNFDAKDFKGKHLRYRAECDYVSEEDFNIRIRARR